MKTDSAPPSGILRDLLLCLWAVHCRCQAETHHHHHRLASPIACHDDLIHNPPSRLSTQPTSHHFTSNNSPSGLRTTLFHLHRKRHCSLRPHPALLEISSTSRASRFTLSAHQLQQSSREPINLSILNQNHHNFPVQPSLKFNTLQSFCVPHHPIWRTQLNLAQDNIPVL